MSTKFVVADTAPDTCLFIVGKYSNAYLEMLHVKIYPQAMAVFEFVFLVELCKLFSCCPFFRFLNFFGLLLRHIFSKAGVEKIMGTAKFVPAEQPTFEVAGKLYTAPHITIATGGRPLVPSVPGEIPFWAAVPRTMSVCVYQDRNGF